MRKRIHVAVVSHGNAIEVAALLADLERSAPLVDLSVLLVLNREEALPFCETDFTFLLHVHRNEQPQGFAANNNLAFRLCRPADDDLFCVINPDVRLAEEVFGPLLGCLEREPRAALVAPLARNSRGENEDNARTLPRPATIVRKALGSPRNSPPQTAMCVRWTGLRACSCCFPHEHSPRSAVSTNATSFTTRTWTSAAG